MKPLCSRAGANPSLASEPTSIGLDASVSRAAHWNERGSTQNEDASVSKGGQESRLLFLEKHPILAQRPPGCRLRSRRRNPSLFVPSLCRTCTSPKRPPPRPRSRRWRKLRSSFRSLSGDDGQRGRRDRGGRSRPESGRPSRRCWWRTGRPNRRRRCCSRGSA